MENRHIKTLERFLDSLNYVERNYEEFKSIILKADDETLDIFHELEFAKPNSKKSNIKVKQIKLIRQKRRAAKCSVEMLDPLNTFLRYNQKIKIDLFKVIKAMKEIEACQQQTSYSPRILKNSEVAGKHYPVNYKLLIKTSTDLEKVGA